MSTGCRRWSLNNVKRDDGTVYAIYSFFRKVGQALATGLGGFVLALIGYQSAATVQTAEVINRVYDVNILITGLIYLTVLLVMLFTFPLSKKVVDEVTVELKARREKAQ